MKQKKLPVLRDIQYGPLLFLWIVLYYLILRGGFRGGGGGGAAGAPPPPPKIGKKYDFLA